MLSEEEWGSPAAVSLSVASAPPPSSVPRLQLSPKTFGVSIRTALPLARGTARSRRRRTSPHRRRSGSSAAPAAQTPHLESRARGSSRSRLEKQPRPRAPAPGRRPRRLPRGSSPGTCLPLGPRSPPTPPRPRPPSAAHPPAACRALQLRLGSRLVRVADFSPPAGSLPTLRQPEVSSRHGPGPGARSPPPAAPGASGAQLILNWQGGDWRGRGVPLNFRLGEDASPPRL